MTEPARTPLVTIATTDLCAITRGRSVAAAKLERSRSARRGLGAGQRVAHAIRHHR